MCFLDGSREEKWQWKKEGKKRRKREPEIEEAKSFFRPLFLHFVFTGKVLFWARPRAVQRKQEEAKKKRRESQVKEQNTQ